MSKTFVQNIKLQPDSAFSSERIFRLWFYGCGHSTLVIRAPKDSKSRNLDIIFSGVYFFDVHCGYIHSLKLVTPTDTEIENIHLKISTMQDYSGEKNIFVQQDNIYVMEDKHGNRFFIVSSFCDVQENDLDYSKVPDL
jgi:hypothetical protein